MARCFVGVLLALCIGCAGCYRGSGGSEDAGGGDAGDGAIDFDASPPSDGDSSDVKPPPLDAEALRSCGEMRTYGTVERERNPDLFEGCERFRGSIDFAHEDISDASVLSSLRWIDGSLNFFRNWELRSLTGLEQLEHVGDLTIRSDGPLEDLAALERLRTVEGRLLISSNPALRSLHGLEGLEEMGSLILEISPDFTDELTLDVLECLRRIDGDVRFWNVRRSEVDALLERVEVDGTVTLDGEVIAGGGEDAGP